MELLVTELVELVDGMAHQTLELLENGLAYQTFELLEASEDEMTHQTLGMLEAMKQA